MVTRGDSPQAAADHVRDYLRGQNLEQMGRVAEAIEFYEAAVAGGFDAVGPYDRLIALYGDEARHADVVRVVDRALECVKTYDDKRAWYRTVRAGAERAAAATPPAAPKRNA